MSCPRCPCPETCRGLPAYCTWAAREPADPIELRHICDRSAMGPMTSYPPLATQVVNLARSLWGWATDGFRVADDDEQARRRAICAACPNWDAAARRCRLCGCATDYKVRMRAEHCPLDPPRW